MADVFTKGFEDLMKFTNEFIEKQKGTWDSDSWMSYMSDFSSKGFEITKDIQTNIESVADSMKKVYESMGKAKDIEKIMREITESVVEFVKKNQGTWDHAAWESFLKGLQDKGITMTKETTDYIGGILEAAKELYKVPEIAKKTTAKSQTK